MKNIISILGFILILQMLYVAGFQIKYIPSPFDIIRTSILLFTEGVIFPHLLSSFAKVSVGFLLAALSAIIIGLLLGWFTKASQYINPIIELFRPIPPIAWIPISILIFGLGNKSAYFIIFTGAFFPIFTNTYFGAVSLPEIFTNVSRTFEITKFKYLTNVLIPFSLPYIFTGLKSGLGMAWMSVIAAELVSGQAGLGYFIQYNRLLLRTDYIVSGMVYIGIVGFVSIAVINLLEKLIIKWK